MAATYESTAELSLTTPSPECTAGAASTRSPLVADID